MTLASTPQGRGTAGVYVISVTASLTGLHPQTLRAYDRLGLVRPARTGGRNRLYSPQDVQRLLRVSPLTSQGVNLAGIARILLLEDRLRELEREVAAERERIRAQPPGTEPGDLAQPARPSPGSP